MLKIIATIADFGSALHMGADVERESFVIEVPTKNIPKQVKKYVDTDDMNRLNKTITLSILNEEEI